MKAIRKRNLRNGGFTLAELIMAMWVMAIILTAVASLAFALGVANDSADDTAEFQSRMRFTTLKITDLVKNCKLVCGNTGSRLAIWRSDDNGDAEMNPSEIIYIEYNSSTDKISLLEFEPFGTVADWDIAMNNITDGSFRSWMGGSATWNYTVLMEDCIATSFATDVGTPFSNKVMLNFGFLRNGRTDMYQINASLRSYAGHLLNSSGAIVSDDDE